MNDINRSVSVVIPIYNGQNYIAKCINGIQRNISNTDEVLIIDDGSTDSGMKKLSKIIKNDPRFRVIKNPQKGIVSALNLGLREAANNWIARFDVDDEYERTRLFEQRALISEGISAIFCDYIFITKENRNLGTMPSAITPSAVPVSLYSTQRTPHPGVIFNKNACIDVGGYREQDTFAEDLSLWLRMTRTGSLISVPKPLLKYRISSDSSMGKNRKIAISKSNELLKNIGLDIKTFDNCIQDISSTFEIYDQNCLSPERKALLIRDLYFHQRINGESTFTNSIIFKELSKLAIKPENYLGILRITRDYFARREFRFSQ